MSAVHGREYIGVSRRGSTEISSHVHSFQDEEGAINDAVFFFYRREVTNWEKQMTVILGLGLTNVKQLLDEVEHDIMNYQYRGLCYLPKPKAEADNTDTRFW